jgi:hypothetical protein
MENSPIEKMSAVEIAFRDAYDHTLSHYPDVTRRNAILKFVSGIVMQYAMYLAFTSDGLIKTMKNVFGNDTVRDFTLRLTGAFFVRLGISERDTNNLPEILASAMCVFPAISANIDPGTVAIPEELKTRLPEYEDVKALLLANKWLMTIAMISL